MTDRERVIKWGESFFLLFILAAAFFIRVCNLSAKTLNFDEGSWIKVVKEASGYGYFSSHADIFRPFYGWLLFFSTKFFSSPEYASRIPAVLLGTATIMLTYKLTQRMYGRLAGFCSAIFLAFLPWHIIESRAGYEVITVPFFGSAIALTLTIYLQGQRSRWFFLYCFLVGFSSLYTYKPAVLFIPISVITLIALRKEIMNRRKLSMIAVGLLIFLATAVPCVLPQLTGKSYFLKLFYHPFYQINPFNGNLLINLAKNFQANSPWAGKLLFVNSAMSFGHSPAFGEPMLIGWAVLLIITVSLIFSLVRRSWADKIILIWLAAGYIGSVAGVNICLARYMIIILVPAIILMGKFIRELIPYIQPVVPLKRVLVILATLFFIGVTVIIELFQWSDYRQRTAFMPGDNKLYGCREAIDYLNRIPDIYDCDIKYDTYMELCGSLRVTPSRGMASKKKCVYYLFWSPESEPMPVFFINPLRYRSFIRTHPGILPIKTIYYPYGRSAVYIFRVDK